MSNESLLITAALFAVAFGALVTALEHLRHPPATPLITFSGIAGVYLGLCGAASRPPIVQPVSRSAARNPASICCDARPMYELATSSAARTSAPTAKGEAWAGSWVIGAPLQPPCTG
jgi:hypothetical protein